MIGILLARALAGEALEIWGDGSIIRDYMHVSDLARFCVATLEGESCGVFNAGSEEGYSINEIISLIREMIDEQLKVNHREGL